MTASIGTSGRRPGSVDAPDVSEVLQLKHCPERGKGRLWGAGSEGHGGGLQAIPSGQREYHGQ